MKLFGDSLREARDKRGVTLDAIARETRISRRYLEALERSDLDTLPGGAFDTGYIRSYAACLGIEPAPLLEAYSQTAHALGRGTEERERERLAELYRLVEKRPAANRGKRSLGRTAVLGALAVLSAAAAVLGARALLRGPAPGSGPVRPVREAAVAAPQAEEEAPRGAEAGPPAPEPAPVSDSGAVPSPSPSLSVSGYGVGTAVVDHRLEGRSDHFSPGTEVWFWTRVVGGKSGQILRHVWRWNGRIAMASELRIGGPHWRTFSRLRLPSDADGGTWSVEARTSDGRLLARQEFSCLK